MLVIETLKNKISDFLNSNTSFCSRIYSTPFGIPFRQFNSRKGVLVRSSFANDQFRRISTKFQHHFKICLLWFLHEKNVAFTLISLSFQLSFELLVQIPVQLLLELEPNLLVQIELEFELSRMQMKRPLAIVLL